MEKYVPHQSYLLRLWPTRRSGVTAFRVSLESVATGERRDFPDLGRLLAFLQAQEKGNLKNSEDTSDGPQHE
jgi:hypothetical protein